jgi:hypothetical protein
MNCYEILLLVKEVEIFSILSPSEYGFLVNNIHGNTPFMFFCLRFPLISFNQNFRSK